MARFISGQWNAICDVCGFEFKSPELRKRWDGLMVCKRDFETRHPQDMIRMKPERITPPWVRPEAPDEFIAVCTIVTSSGYAGLGAAGCMQAGKDDLSYAFLIAL